MKLYIVETDIGIEIYQARGRKHLVEKLKNDGIWEKVGMCQEAVSPENIMEVGYDNKN